MVSPKMASQRKNTAAGAARIEVVGEILWYLVEKQTCWIIASKGDLLNENKLLVWDDEMDSYVIWMILFSTKER